MLAALLGGGALWLGQQAGLVPQPGLRTLEQRLGALESRPLPADPAGALADLSRTLEAQAARLDALEALPAPAAPDLSGLEGALADLEARTAALEAQVAGEAETVQTLGSRLDALEALPRPAPAAPRAFAPPASPLESLVAELEAGQADLVARVEDLEAARDALEEARAAMAESLERLEDESARALGTAADALSRAEAAEARAEAVAAEAEAARSRAEAAEAEAEARAALARIAAALETGAPLAPALEELRESGAAPPPAFEAAAETGLPTLAALRADFPAAARAALERARAEGLLDAGGGAVAFLRGQFGIRSTLPREGDDPDAILSRAEAALAANQLDEALREIAALPDPVREALRPWLDRAEARAAAEAALRDGLGAAAERTIPAAP
ncbi:hypothetical protein [Rubellimicrobium sp. CFH 75288]|uniref:hypothetical protein n=1 Tax=Rubellimicrobium sp. CFH 75288 TaxID=2697034 RepID=UPI0014120A83|nr:hypothetical protein [Rubellimicrobium sp. CFH 75288]NAZ37803.1 hypothetical protein [Rubellimicrobium sp. CFH 75288]